MDINLTYQTHQQQILELNKICDQLYQENFNQFLDNFQTIKLQITSNKRVSDADLEYILVTLPLNLISMSESVSRLKLEQEALKLSIKEKEYNICSESKLPTEVKRKEFASIQTINDKLLLNVYVMLIERAENEISLYRELIMGAKKIWDARRKTDNMNPTTEQNIESLPNYDFKLSSKTYVK